MENPAEGQRKKNCSGTKKQKKKKQKTDKVEGAHHGQSVEKDVDKFWSAWVGQRSVQQALNYTLGNKMY